MYAFQDIISSVSSSGRKVGYKFQHLVDCRELKKSYSDIHSLFKMPRLTKCLQVTALFPVERAVKIISLRLEVHSCHRSNTLHPRRLTVS